MERTHIHKTGRKSKHSQNQGLERFLASRLFIVIGIVFLFIGLYYSLSSSGGLNGLNDMLMNFLKPTDNAPEMVVVGNGSANLLFYFLPAALALIVSILYARKFSTIAYPTSLFIAIYLIVIQVIIFVHYINYGDCYYPTFFIASLILFLPVLLLFITAFLHRKSAILIFTCFYFYISLILFAEYYGRPFDYLFPFVIFFSFIIAWVSQKIERLFINWINFSFAICFFGLFWIRKFVINSRPDLLTNYLILGILFYLLFYAIVIYASNAKEHPLRKWMQLVLTWSNLLFFLGTTSFVLIKYYSFGYLWIFVSVLLLFNLLGMYLLNRNNAVTWTLPHYFTCMFLAALVMPLLLHQNMVLLFMAGISVFMLVYANEFKDKAAIGISLMAMAVVMVVYLFSWMNSYLPALLAQNNLPGGALMWHGVVSGVAMVVALAFTHSLLYEAEIPLSRKWFRKSKYDRFIRGFMLFSLFLTMGWIGFSLIYISTGTVIYSPVGWFISGCIFFIIMINYYTGEQSSFKKPLLYLAATFALLYPVLVHWNMIIWRENAIIITSLRNFWWSSLSILLLHYFALILFVILGIMTARRIYLRNVKNMIVQRGVQVVTIVFLLFLCCTEYDNLSVVISGYSIGDGILTLNQHLPYSIILWLLSVCVFVWAIFNHDGFLRNMAVVLYIGFLMKVFAYDFPTLDSGSRSAVFFVVGLFLIGLAVVYPRLLKMQRVKNSPQIGNDK